MGGGPTHPPCSLPFIQGLMTGKPSLLKCGFAHSPGDENPKFDRRAAFGRHTLTSLPPTVAAHSKSTIPQSWRRRKEEKRAIWLTDVWEPVNRGRDMVRGAEYAGGSDLGRLVRRRTRQAVSPASCSCCLFLGPIHPCSGQAGPATFCHWIYSVQELNTFQ